MNLVQKKLRPWIWVFILIFAIHLFGNSLIYKRRLESSISLAKIQHLNHAIQLAKQRKEELSREIEAFNNPLWSDEIMKEELGLVRQSETKIVFQPD
jgi:hypothetical protein